MEMKQKKEIVMELFIRSCSVDELLPVQAAPAAPGMFDWLPNFLG